VTGWRRRQNFTTQFQQQWRRRVLSGSLSENVVMKTEEAKEIRKS
jgi:hypothetical protein